MPDILNYFTKQYICFKTEQTGELSPYLLIHHLATILKGASQCRRYSVFQGVGQQHKTIPQSEFSSSSEANTREFNPLSETFALLKSSAISKTAEMQSSCFKTRWSKSISPLNDCTWKLFSSGKKSNLTLHTARSIWPPFCEPPAWCLFLSLSQSIALHCAFIHLMCLLLFIY